MEKKRNKLHTTAGTTKGLVKATGKTSATAKLTLDRAGWVKAAYAILSKDGIGGIRVEVLAKKLHVTKGSFYWHFRDRKDLHQAVLEEWRVGRISDIQKQTTATAGQEQAQLLHVIEVYSAARNRHGMAIEQAMRDWARRDALAAAVVAEVDKVRLHCAAKLFEQHGLSPEEAHHRSVLLYSYVFGISLLTFGSHVANEQQTRDWIARLIATQ